MNQKEFLPARKGLGQNFLHDARVIETIVDALNPALEDRVVEIGPGRGALTRPLLEAGCKLHLIEFDRDLAEHWHEQVGQGVDLEVHEGDVLKFDFESLAGEGQIRVIGNLPYNISSPVLFRLLSVRRHISDMVLMFQKEVVDRIVAEPGGKQYGRLSVMVQQACSVERIIQVPAGAFSPPPKVKSAVVRLVPRNNAGELKDEAVFARVVKQAFSMRRKTLRNTLKEYLGDDDFDAAGLTGKERPEQLTIRQFTELTNYIAKK